MKFILTESKLENIIFKYLDNQDFVKIEKKKHIYFVNSIDDRCFQIDFDEDISWCYIDVGLNREISSFFSLEKHKSKEIISKWVENTLQIKILHTFFSDNCSIPLN